ncbi:MAG: ATP-binding protein [Saprospiraceae bacterium]|nr:tetratricopeptide repeat protein [Lewinella sp.]
MRPGLYGFEAFLLLLFPTLLCGSDKDSLLSIWHDSTQIDSVRFQAYYDLIYSSYLFSTPDTALVYAEILQERAHEANDPYWQGKAINLQGIYYALRSEQDQALAHYLKSLQYYQASGHLLAEVDVYNNIGLSYHFSGDYLNAIRNYQKALAIGEQENWNGRARWMNLANLSKVYEELGDYESALHYIRQVIDLSDDPSILAGSLHSLAVIYAKQENYSEAEKYFSLALEKSAAINNQTNLAFTYLDLGKLKLKTSIWSEAEAALQKAVDLFQNMGNRQYLASAHAQLGIVQYHRDLPRRGLEYCTAAERLVANNRFPAIQAEVCECYYLNQEKIQDYRGALRNYERLSTIRDSLVNEEKIRIASKMDMQYQFDLEKAKLESERTEALLQAELKQSRTVYDYSRFIAFLLLVMLLGSILFFYYYRRRTEEHHHQLETKNLELTKKNRVLERFAFITSHDLKEPVRGISAFADLLRKKIDSPDGEEYLHYIKSSAVKLYDMIESIMTFTRLNNETALMEQVEMETVLEEVLSNLKHKIVESKASISVKKLPVLTGIESQMMLLWQNIIDNAIKFNGTDDPRITIGWEENQQEYSFHIKDNGIGVDPAFAEKIFEPFSRLDSRYNGSGLGLSIARDIVQQHGGRIWVTANAEQGSTFHFTLHKFPH